MTIEESPEQTIKRLKGLLEKATPGPWHIYHSGAPRSIWADRHGESYQHKVAQAAAGKRSRGHPEEGPHNAALIVEAVNALPHLIAEITRLKALVGEQHEAMADVMTLRRLSTTPEQRAKADSAIAVWRKVQAFLAKDTSDGQG